MSWVGETAVAVLAVLGILWSIVLMSLLTELRRRSQRLEGVLRVLETELPPTLADIREAARGLSQVVRDVGEATPHLRAALSALEEAGENVRGATGAVRSLFGYRFIPMAGILAGLRTGLRYAWRLYSRRRES